MLRTRKKIRARADDELGDLRSDISDEQRLQAAIAVSWATVAEQHEGEVVELSGAKGRHATKINGAYRQTSRP